MDGYIQNLEGVNALFDNHNFDNVSIDTRLKELIVVSSNFTKNFSISNLIQKAVFKMGNTIFLILNF